MSIYMCSQELLLLFTILAPASIVIDIIRLAGTHHYRGHGWLVFFTVLEMGAKAAGGVFGWSLHRSLSGEGGGAYAAINPQGGAGTGAQGGYTPAAAPPAPVMGGPGGLGAPEDPFAAYAPPRADHATPVSSSYQPFPHA